MSAAASRAWGRGHVDWTPANVAAKVTVSISSPQKRNVHVSTTYTDDEGRIKPTEVILDADSNPRPSARSSRIWHQNCREELLYHPSG